MPASMSVAAKAAVLKSSRSLSRPQDTPQMTMLLAEGNAQVGEGRTRMNQSVTYHTLHHSDGLAALAFPACSFAQAVTIKNNLQAEYNAKHHIAMKRSRCVK